MVEALTIVLAAGVTRGWRSSLIDVAAALVVLATVVGVLGPARMGRSWVFWSSSSWCPGPMCACCAGGALCRNW